jgi:hypothetical protein
MKTFNQFLESLTDFLHLEFTIISEDVLLVEDLVRLDIGKKIPNFNKDKKLYFAKQTFRPDRYESGPTDAWHRQNRTPYRSSGEEEKAIKSTQKRLGLSKFTGIHAIDTDHPEAQQLGHYVVPRHIRSFIHNHPEHGPTITFRESDREEIEKHRPWLTTFRDSGNFRTTTGAERVSRDGAKVQIKSQEQIHPVEHLKKLGLHVRFVADGEYANEHAKASKLGNVSTEGSVD